jgi:hypothetical protein
VPLPPYGLAERRAAAAALLMLSFCVLPSEGKANDEFAVDASELDAVDEEDEENVECLAASGKRKNTHESGRRKTVSALPSCADRQTHDHLHTHTGCV